MLCALRDRWAIMLYIMASNRCDSVSEQVLSASCCLVSLWQGVILILHNIAPRTATAKVEHRSDYENPMSCPYRWAMRGIFLIFQRKHSADCSNEFPDLHTTQPRQVKWGEVHTSVVTKRHQHACISYSQEDIKWQLKKISNGRNSQLNQYLSFKPHWSFKPTWIFFKDLVCPSNGTFDRN